jgi:hypothetical protein
MMCAVVVEQHNIHVYLFLVYSVQVENTTYDTFILNPQAVAVYYRRYTTTPVRVHW